MLINKAFRRGRILKWSYLTKLWDCSEKRSEMEVKEKQVNNNVDLEHRNQTSPLMTTPDAQETPVVIDDIIVEIPRKRRCQGCREWGACCAEVGQEIREQCTSCDCRSQMKTCCTKDTVKNKLPLLKWAPKYRLAELQGDVIAGLTVGLTVIPQGLAYAQIAELPPQYGLYSAFMGCIVYFFMGTSKDITLGPTAIMSLMTAEFGAAWYHGDATVAIVLTLLCGIIQLIMGLLNIGFLVEFISYPVINSFTTAAAITIAVGQVKNWLGLTHIPREFMHQVYETCVKLPETNLWDFLLGLACMFILYGMKRMKNVKYNDPPGEELTTRTLVGRKIVWLLGTARNAIVVIVASGMVAVLLCYNIDVLSLTDPIQGGLPPFKPPSFTTTDGNTTYTAHDIFQKIGSGFFIIPMIGLIETIAIGKAFSRKNNYNIDANQELLAIGVANIVGSFVASYPVTGSFSRTAVNSQSGVKTPAGGLMTAALVLLALGVLTPLFRFIPDAALAAVIIMAVLDMASFELIIKIWRVKRQDLLPWIATFVFSFVMGIEYGIMIGVGISLLFLLFSWARPGMDVHKRDMVSLSNIIRVNGNETGDQVVVMQLDSGLRFPGVEYVKELVLKQALEGKRAKGVVLDCTHVSALDYSTTNGLIGLFEDFSLHQIPFIIAGMQPAVDKTMRSDHHALARYSSTVDNAVQQIHATSAHGDYDPSTPSTSSRTGDVSSTPETMDTKVENDIAQARADWFLDGK